MSSEISEGCPSSPNSWKKEYLENSLSDKTIFDLENYNSGSSISYRQFLLLRVLWIKENTEKFSEQAEVRGKWFKKIYEDKARDEFDSLRLTSAGWKNYLESIKAPPRPTATRPAEEHDYLPLGTFALVRYYQESANGIDSEEISQKTRYWTRSAANKDQKTQSDPFSTPSRSDYAEPIDSLFEMMALGSPQEPTPSSLMTAYSPPSRETAIALAPTADEQIVNTALILFLTAITMHITSKLHWSLERRAFQVQKGMEKVFEARVDGILHQRSNKQNVLAIIEVKPRQRWDKQREIQMQEAAQMAAWISESPGMRNRGRPQRYHQYLQNAILRFLIYALAEFSCLRTGMKSG